MRAALQTLLLCEVFEVDVDDERLLQAKKLAVELVADAEASSLGGFQWALTVCLLKQPNQLDLLADVADPSRVHSRPGHAQSASGAHPPRSFAVLRNGLCGDRRGVSIMLGDPGCERVVPSRYRSVARGPGGLGAHHILVTRRLLPLNVVPIVITMMNLTHRHLQSMTPFPVSWSVSFRMSPA